MMKTQIIEFYMTGDIWNCVVKIAGHDQLPSDAYIVRKRGNGFWEFEGRHFFSLVERIEFDAILDFHLDKVVEKMAETYEKENGKMSKDVRRTA